MSGQQKNIKRSELINRLVIDNNTIEEIGHVDDIWLDTTTHKIVGFTCKANLLSWKKQAFTWEQIESIGDDSIMVNFDPEAKAPDKPKQLIPLIGHEVHTKSGNQGGKITDYVIDNKTGEIVNYLYISKGWRGVLDNIYQFSPKSIIKISTKRVLVPDNIVEEPQIYTEGLQQKLHQAAETIREDYAKNKIDLEGLRRGARGIAEQVKDKAKEVAEKAKEGAHNISEQMRDKAKEAVEKAKEDAHNMAEKVTETAKEGMHNIAEKVTETAHEITDQAKEKIIDVKAQTLENEESKPAITQSLDMDIETLGEPVATPIAPIAPIDLTKKNTETTEKSSSETDKPVSNS
jgi:uncharacterized protein YrrD